MFESLEEEINTCQISDVHTLSKKLARARKLSAGQSQEQSINDLQKSINTSKTHCSIRDQSVPRAITFPEILPVSQKADELIALMSAHQVLVVAGDTGSGKTTQLPKMCLAAGFGRRGMIGHTQPRRLAATSVADRIASELGVDIGDGVGYQIRFNDKTSPSTFLKLMTDGILLTEIQHDRFLNKYEVLIIDEAHERSLNIDFLLGFIKQLLPKRPDLKVLITSATIDLEKFSQHFSHAPIVSVSGRTYPVKTEYRPPMDAAKTALNSDELTIDTVCDEVGLLLRTATQSPNEANDILIFFATEREIREAALALRKKKFRDTEILPLYSRLKHAEQVKIFQSHKGFRVVLATNVAETSITVPGIRYVIDTGTARISRYSLQSKVQRLPIEAISQASANQRQGRCGRVAEGTCIRLYSEADFLARPEYTDPEIRRTNLASVILRMRALRLGEVEHFPYLDKPEKKAINEGFKLLFELNALTPQKELTECGNSISKIPIDPKYGRMLFVAASKSCLKEMLVVCSALSIQDPRELGVEGRQVALEKLSKFNHPDSDFLSFVNLWNAYENERQQLTQGQLRKYCKQNHLSFVRMREWREVHRQLLLSCQQQGWRLNHKPADYRSIHECIISGSLNQIANKFEGNQYLGNRNRKFKLLSSSVLSDRKPDWIVTGDLLETHQVFASMAAKIQPEWVEHMAMNLVRREVFSPHWSAKRQRVMAYERVQLYGLTLVPKSMISFSAKDNALAREIFIAEGIVGQQLRTSLDFYKQNISFLDKLTKLEDKIRRPDLMLSESDVIRFYSEQLPLDISSTQQLESWVNGKNNSSHTTSNRALSEQLLMENSDLLKASATDMSFEQYPDQTDLDRNRVELGYVFDPISERDGATIKLPELLLYQLSEAELEWSVPGIIREKCIVLLKSLPKSVRKQLIPISGFVDEIIDVIGVSDGTLVESLIKQIANRKKLRLNKHDFCNVEMPQHLIVKISLIDKNQKEIAFSQSISQLQNDFASDMTTNSGSSAEIGQSNQPLKEPKHSIEVESVKDWSFGDLPKSIEIGDDLVLRRYPGIMDNGECVAVRLFSDKLEAEIQHQQGLCRLLMLNSVQQKNAMSKRLTRSLNSLALSLVGQQLGTVEEMVFAIYRDVFNISNSWPSSKTDFENLLNEGKSKLMRAADTYAELLETIIEKRTNVRKLLSGLPPTTPDYVKNDVQSQITNLFPDDFIGVTEFVWLKEMPRYLDAIAIRLGKAPHLGAKDQVNSQNCAGYWRKYTQLKAGFEIRNETELNQLRWMLEEYRVSLFAQNLKTKIPVSEKRIEKVIQLIE